MEISLSIPIVAQTLEVIVALIGSATQGHAHVWARAADESHVRIQGLLKPGSVLMPNVPVTIEGQADSRDGGPCWCFRAILLLGTWWHPDPATVEDHVRVHGSTTTEVYAEFWVLNCHQRSHRGSSLGSQSFSCKWLVLLPRARISTGPKLPPRTTSTSMVHLQLESVWRLSEPCETKSECHSEPTMPFAGSGKAGPFMPERWPPSHSTEQGEPTLIAYMIWSWLHTLT